MTTAHSSGPYFIETEIRVPNGQYQGTWGGYIVRMDVNGQQVVFRTDLGISKPAAKVTVTMKDGEAFVSTN